MGLASAGDKRPLTINDINNRKLVLNMLQAEDSLIHGEAQDMYKRAHYLGGHSLTVEHAVQRMILDKFGFETNHSDLENYRSIFKTYYHDSTDYDRDVLNSVTYMRENRCLYYQNPVLHIGQNVSDQLSRCHVHSIVGDSAGTLLGIIDDIDFEHILIGAFSKS